MLIFPLGDNALTVEFGNEISVELNQRAIALAKKLTAEPFPGMTEAVPAYSSVSVFYDLTNVRRSFREYETAFSAAAKSVHDRSAATADAVPQEGRTVEIPVSFDRNDALDLDEAVKKADLSTDEFIEIFLSRTYRVFMLGFLPGFAYMGEVDERIAVPRKETPRTRVPKGSVGIAGKQTGIYPADSPGGWQIIGRTDVKLFDPGLSEPCLLRAGDEVRFVKG